MAPTSSADAATALALAPIWQGLRPMPAMWMLGVVALLAAFGLALRSAVRKQSSWWNGPAVFPAAILLCATARILVRAFTDVTYRAEDWQLEMFAWTGGCLVLLALLTAAARSVAPNDPRDKPN